MPSAFVEPRVGVGVLVVDEHGRVLLTLRRRSPEAGCWSILGGRLAVYLFGITTGPLRCRGPKTAVEGSL
jgi:hypothetical protein